MWKILLSAFLWKICNHRTVGGKWIATEILQSPIGILQHSFIVHAIMRLSSICRRYLEPAWILSLPMVLNLYCRWVKFGGGGMSYGSGMKGLSNKMGKMNIGGKKGY
jgi:hypothetical protein